MSLEPLSWANRPALIESLFPVQKLSVESFKEQMAGKNKTLTALGSFWKGRKPLILNKACILGCLLPSTGNPVKDLEVFELLMGMDPESLRKRLEVKLKGQNALRISGLLAGSYHDQVSEAIRAEEIDESFLFEHIWSNVNASLGTFAKSFSELINEIGIARYGHRPKVADVFCGSGQIPFEAARLSCEVYASDLNPIACLLTWGSFNIVGANKEKRISFNSIQNDLTNYVQKIIDDLGVDSDGNGWTLKSMLYCIEAICPETGWKVPLIPSLIVSKGYRVVAKLIPIPMEKRYDIEIVYVQSDEEVEAAGGTVQKGELVHSPDGVHIYRTKIGTLRGDFKDTDGNQNKLRLWGINDFIPQPDDIFQERLYCVQWMRKKPKGKGDEYQFRSVTQEDIEREQKVINYVREHLTEWQEQGWVPDMVIEPGDKTDEPIRTRGWTHWHHLFNARQLLYLGIIRSKSDDPELYVRFMDLLNYSSRLCPWATSPKRQAKDGSGKQTGGASDNPANVFYNQALNTLFSYGCRSLAQLLDVFMKSISNCYVTANTKVETIPTHDLKSENDIYITDPPYGDAVKYEEITEFFIAWLRKNPPQEFANWTWDSRRSHAIKGEDEAFRQGMIAAYKKMAEMMPDNGIQVMMFTHQSGSLWADMTNIIWASGLQVTAAWYVVTESDSAIRQGANVTGTVLLVLRKRTKRLETFRDDLGWEIEAAVKQQVESLVGLDKRVREQNSEGLYNDADLQMAGYAAALKVLTTYAVIDGKEMEIEAKAPRQKGVKNFVDQMIDFAVQTAVQFLVPVGFEADEWQKLSPVERYYLKMSEMEAEGNKSLDNYQNFAKAFKVKHFEDLMGHAKANSARLKLSYEFKTSYMSGDAELAQTPLRALLYAMSEINKEVEIDDVLLHLMDNTPNFMAKKPLIIKVADYLAVKRAVLKPTKEFHPDREASAARIIAEALRNQRL